MIEIYQPSADKQGLKEAYQKAAKSAGALGLFKTVYEHDAVLGEGADEASAQERGRAIGSLIFDINGNVAVRETHEEPNGLHGYRLEGTLQTGVPGSSTISTYEFSTPMSTIALQPVEDRPKSSVRVIIGDYIVTSNNPRVAGLVAKQRLEQVSAQAELYVNTDQRELLAA